MKKTAYLLLFVLLALVGCGKKADFTLKGNINGLTSDTLLVYYQLPEYKLDTILMDEGTFEYTIHPDTFTIFSLVLDSAHVYPIYADKGGTVTLNGTVSDLIVKGNGENQILSERLALLKNVPSDSLYIKVDSLIKSDAYTFTNLYLIDKYYVHDHFPDYKKIKDLMGSMSGIIKDTPYAMNLLARIEYLTESENNRNIYSFQIKDREGKNINWPSIRNQYILIDFWASWDKASVEAQDSLVPVLKALKKEKFLIVSVSLDLDREAWLKASDRDTTQWKQVCDFTGWNNKLVKDQSIHSLPSNILLNTNKRIIERDIRGKTLVDRVKELIKQDEERAKKEAERKRKNRTRK